MRKESNFSHLFVTGKKYLLIAENELHLQKT